MTALAHRGKIISFPKRAVTEADQIRHLLERRVSLLREKENYERELIANDWPRVEFEVFWKTCLQELKLIEMEIEKIRHKK